MRKSLYTEVIERRDKVQVFADIIRVTDKPTKITRILRFANLQYNTFLDCVDRLCSVGFLERVGPDKSEISSRGRYRYQATKTGEEWCDLLDEIYGGLEIYELEPNSDKSRQRPANRLPLS
jgi:predicted transcriptional regulator